MLSRSAIHNSPRRLVPGESAFNHAFGGPFGVFGKNAGQVSFHLLFDLDLRDPLLSFLELPNFERLPLIFPLCYDGADVSYKIKPNGAVELLGKGEYSYTRDWPYADYPSHFPRVPVTVVPYSYEEYRAAVFSYAVGPHLLRDDDKDLIDAIGAGVTQLGGIQELPFGDPASLLCPNPACYWHTNCCSMFPLATIWNSPIPGIEIWGDGADVMIGYFMCNDCRSVYATTMCD